MLTPSLVGLQAPAVEPFIFAGVVDADDNDEAVGRLWRVPVRDEQSSLVRLLGDVRVEDAEVITTQDADDVGQEHAVRARSADEGRGLVDVVRTAHLQLEAGLSVELAHGYGSPSRLPCVAPHVLAGGSCEELLVIDVPLLADLGHHPDEVVVAVQTPSIARWCDAPACARQMRDDGLAYGVPLANALEEHCVGHGLLVLVVLHGHGGDQDPQVDVRKSISICRFSHMSLLSRGGSSS